MKSSTKHPMRIALVVFHLLPLGCNTTPPEPEHSVPERQGNSSSQISIATKGYIHTNLKSKFDLGGNISRMNVAGDGERWAGANGVFVHRINGHSMAIVNADSPLRLASPIKDAAASNQLLLDYLTSAGAPVEQLGHTHVTTTFSSNPETSEGQGSDIFRGYNSHVQRVMDGVIVVESVAWAKFSDKGEVLAESFYWPELPASTLAEVAKFKAALATEESAGLRAKLPGGNEIGLRIHHTPLTHIAPISVVVSFDVLQEVPTRPRMLYLDLQGNELNFPWSPTNLPQSSNKEE